MNNWLTRTISGIVFLVLMTGAILYGPVTCAILLGLVIAGAMHEFLTISTGRLNLPARILSVAAGLLFFLLLLLVCGYGLRPAWLLLAFLPVVFIFISGLYVKSYNVHETVRTPDGRTARAGNGYEYFPFVLFALVYIAVPLSSCSLILFDEAGHYSGKTLLSLFIILWATDVGAYCFGTLFGQKNGHRLFPSISPKKSWEGFWGGTACALLSGSLLYFTGLLHLPMGHSLMLALLIGVFGVFGDLVESQLKRNFEVKDSGRIMPGHGGLLDRFDGALLAFPVAVMYLILFTTL